MANPYNSQYQQNLGNMPPLQTQGHPPQQQQQQPARPFSPPSYQQSPSAMSPTMSGIPPAKRQRVSPHPPSPYTSPFNNSPYAPIHSPYSAGSPQTQPSQYLGPPPASATPTYQTPSFNQPQPYHHPGDMSLRSQQTSMPPPKVPASKAHEGELEKANPRDMDVSNISDVLTGSGIDLRAEEEYLTHSFGTRKEDTSFSQTSGSTISPHGSFNQWGQAGAHGAFQGTGPLGQKPLTEEELKAELLRKHERAARALSEAAQAPLTDPFLLAANLRQRIAQRAYQHGIQVNLEGVFDRIPDTPQNLKRSSVTGPNGETIIALQSDSLLNQGAPFVELLSLISLAAEERVRTVLEDAFALAQSRQMTSHGIVPPNLADIAQANGDVKSTTTVPTNISKTAWEGPDGVVSPKAVALSNHIGSARLPTPPTEAPPTPQPTISFSNPIASALKRKVDEDYNYEKARIAKRQKRLQGSAAVTPEVPTVAPIVPEKMTKKERDRLNKAGQTEEVLHRKANETASMALGGKKKYSWMTGGGGGGGGFGSGASTPRLTTTVGGSGVSTPAQPQVDRALLGTRRSYGEPLESTDYARKIQLRDIIHVLDLDGKQRRTLVSILARLKSTDKDEDKKPVSAR